MIRKPSDIIVRNTRPDDFPGIIELTNRVYPNAPSWAEKQLTSHLEVFPEGQLVAEETSTNRIVGMAASLIILWDDYELNDNWRCFTDNGMFTNHDPKNGRTLYGAEVMVMPKMQGRGAGKKLYSARRELARKLGLLRIRAGARLRNYHKYADRMSAEDYTIKIISGEIRDPTLSFQLKQGFHVIGVVPDYLRHDPESLGYAAVIEWLNDKLARPEDYTNRDPRFICADDQLSRHA